MAFTDYPALLDWTGRQLKSHKKGIIFPHQSPILSRLKLNQEGWMKSVTGFEGRFLRVAGKLEKVKKMGRKLGVKWMQGQRMAKQLYLAES